MVALVRLLLHNELDVPEVNLILGLVLILELVFDLLPELAKVEVPLLLHALHHQLHLQDLQTFEITVRTMGAILNKLQLRKPGW